MQMKIKTKIGPLYLISSNVGLQGVYWKEQKHAVFKKDNGPAYKFLLLGKKQILEYLDGSRNTFDLPLDIKGTDFQKNVWKELLKIPYAETRSYKDISIAINKPFASQAVGTANAKNSLCLIIPCHRVIASDGTLGGYSGGLLVKKKLLQLEASARKCAVS